MLYKRIVETLFDAVLKLAYEVVALLIGQPPINCLNAIYYSVSEGSVNSAARGEHRAAIHYPFGRNFGSLFIALIILQEYLRNKVPVPFSSAAYLWRLRFNNSAKL